MNRRQLPGTRLPAAGGEDRATQPMELRPHHILDILRNHGLGPAFQPHSYGHAGHIVGPKVVAGGNLRVKLVVAADEICRPCKNLTPEGQCRDVLSQLSPPPSKQKYNDDLDRRLLAFLKLKEGMVMTVREFFERVDREVPGIEKICSHPKEDQQRRLAGLIRGLEKSGVRRPSRRRRATAASPAKLEPE